MVVDGAGRPLDGYRVQADLRMEGRQETKEGQTDELGHFFIDGLIPAMYELKVLAPNVYEAGPSLMQLTLGERKKVKDLRLVFRGDTGLSIAGHVRDVSGKPIRGALIQAEKENVGGSQATSYSAADGAFEVPGLKDGPYIVKCSHTDFSRSEAVAVEAGSDNLDVVLLDRGSIKGTVLGADGALESFQVSAILQSYTQYQTQEPFYESVVTLGSFSDPNGQFSLKNVESGDYIVCATAPGHVEARLPVKVTAGGTTQGVILRLKRGGSINGRVTDALGSPISGAMVSLASQTEPVPAQSTNTKSGTTGDFKLDCLTPGNFEIATTHESYLSTKNVVAVTLGTPTAVTVVMSAGAGVEGLVSRDGEAMPNVKVTLNQPGEVGQKTAQSNVNGWYDFSGLREGAFTVVAEISEGKTFRSAHGQGLAAEGAVTQVDLPLDGDKASVEGYVRIDGKPAPAGSVGAHLSSGDRVATVPIQAGGYYKLDDLPVGDFSLGADSPGAMQTDGPTVTTAAGRTIRQDIVLVGAVSFKGVVKGLPEDDPAVVAVYEGQVQVNAATEEELRQTDGFIVSHNVRVVDYNPPGGFQTSQLPVGLYTFVLFSQGQQQVRSIQTVTSGPASAEPVDVELIY